MPVDASIYGSIQQPQPVNLLAQYAGAAQLQNAQQNQLLNRLKIDAAQRDFDNTNALSAAYKGAIGADGTIDQGKLFQSVASSGAGYKLPEIQRSLIETQKARTDADTASFKLANERYGVFQKTMGALAQEPNLTKDMVLQAGQNLVTQGLLPAAMYQQSAATLPDDPQQLRARLVEGLKTQLPPEKVFEIFAPKPTQVDGGNQISFRDTNPNSATYGQATAGAPVQKQATPDAVLSSNTSRANNAATNATSRANSADTINKDFTIAGVNANGTVNNSVEAMAQAIASGKAAPLAGFSLARPGGQAVMRRVFEINPSYDETSYAAKLKASKDFTSGPQSNAMRSIATANAHLDQLGELVDGLGNGDVQLINRIANAYAQQTGKPAPTNFDAVRNIVGQEVVKAIIANNGSAGERDEATATFSRNLSPAQLKGAIQHYRTVMGAQQQSLLQQRRAAGLTDDTLPDYARDSAARDFTSLPSGAGGGAGRVVNFGDLK